MAIKNNGLGADQIGLFQQNLASLCFNTSIFYVNLFLFLLELFKNLI